MKLNELQKLLKPIELTFLTPINGWWDYGAKSGGVFEPNVMKGDYYNDKTGRTYPVKWHVKWECFPLNFYFRMSPPKDKDITKAAKSIIDRARVKIRGDCRIKGITTKILENA